MRQLIFDDVFTMSRILSKLDINLNLDTENNSEDPKKADEKYEKLGLQFVKKIAENAYLARNDINNFLGDLSGMTGEEFGKLLLKESMQTIKQFRELDGIKDFFESAGLLARFK